MYEAKMEKMKMIQEALNDTYTEELRLSRDLARAIDMEMQSYGKIVSEPIYQAWKRLADYYQKQIDAGVQ